MKIPLLLATASTLLILAPAQAGQQTKQPIVVTGAVTLDQWSARTSKQLEQKIGRPYYASGERPKDGVVRVSFLCSETGVPKAVALADSSGHFELDNAALRAVRRLDSLHPLPDGLSPDQKYQAVVLFATSRASYDNQMARLHKDAKQRNAWFKQGGRQVAASVGLMPAS